MGHFIAAALVVSTLTIPPAGHGDPASMSADERREISMSLYREGEALQEASPAEALAKYEEAYHRYTPDLHVFNYNIGMAARAAGQCEVARQAFQRFLVMVDEHEDREHARTQLQEIEAGGCEPAEGAVVPAPAPGPQPSGPAAAGVRTSGPTEADLEHPDLESRKKQREEKIDEELTKRNESKASGMLIGGAVATGIGGLALIGGAVSLGVANRRANALADLASPGPTGFPNGNYSDEDVYDLDRHQLPANNAATIGLFIGGGVATVVGATLIALDFRNRKRRRGTEERSPKLESDPDTAHRPRARLVGLSAGPRRGGALASATLAF